MRYRVKQLSATVFAITLGREKVGQIVKKHDGSGWYRRLQYGQHKLEHTSTSAPDVAAELVRVANRISLCGRNDQAAAQKALQARNEKVVASVVAEEILGDNFLVKAIKETCQDLGLQKQIADMIPRKRIVRRKILL